MKDEVKVCLIGSGRAGMIHGHNFAGSVPGGKIIAVCDPVGDVAENAAKELGRDHSSSCKCRKTHLLRETNGNE